MSGPLEGIRVLDWTQWQMGTVATSFLADYGAEVIHIENRVTGDAGRAINSAFWVLGEERNAYFETNNRGKKSLAIDLAKEEGREVIYRLVAKSDVFAHNFRQGVPEKLKLDYETLSRINPALVYAAASGYGPEGPEAAEPAFDFVGLARSGITSAVATVDGDPNLPGGGLADQMGGVMTSYGILMALLARERKGVGQLVDVSHLGSMITLQGLSIGLINYLQPPPGGTKLTRKQAANPLWNYYPCAGGRWIVFGNLQPDRNWPVFCRALGIANLEHDPKYETATVRAANCEELIAILDEIFITKTVEEWMKILKDTGDIICTPLQTIRDLPNDPQVIANDYIIDVQHEALGEVKVRGLPVALSKTPGAVNPVAPEFGQHTEEVLIDVAGYTWEEIAELRDKEVI